MDKPIGIMAYDKAQEIFPHCEFRMKSKHEISGITIFCCVLFENNQDRTKHNMLVIPASMGLPAEYRIDDREWGNL